MRCIPAIFLCLGIALMSSCVKELPTDPSPTPFIVKVDSMTHPPTASVGDTVAIALFGTIGSNGCYSFRRFEDLQHPLNLDLTVWGEKSPAGLCPAVMVYLNGKEYEFVATQAGVYLIYVHQPDGTTLQDSLLIQE